MDMNIYRNMYLGKYFNELQFCDHYMYFAIWDTIFEYNLFTKLRKVVFHSDGDVQKFFVSKDNLIVATVTKGTKKDIRYTGSKMYWNGNLLKDCDLPMFNFLKANDVECITQIKDSYYDKNGDVVQINNDQFFIVSDDGSRIVYNREYKLFSRDITNIRLKDIFDDNNATCVSKRYGMDPLEWIQGSSFVLIAGSIFLDLNTNRIIKPKYDYAGMFCRFILVIEKLMISLEVFDGGIEIYDIDNMVFPQMILVDDIVAYCSNLDILISISKLNEVGYYRIRKCGNYVLEKIHIGENYLLDQNIVPNVIRIIMETICDTELVRLPNEITCIELYQQLLRLI